MKLSKKAITGYSNYLAFSDGRIYSLKRKLFLKDFSQRQGYRMVKLNNKSKTLHNEKFQ